MYQGIHSPHAPKAIGPYSPAVKLGDFVYLSGQLPIDPLTNELVKGDMYEQTYQVLRNMEAVLSEMGLELRHVVKTTVYVTDLAFFNQFNEIYATVFQDPYPARTTVQVAALPMGAMVEVEALVIDTLAYEAHMHHHHDHDHEGCGCGGHHDHDHEHNHEGCGCGGHHHHHEGETCNCGKPIEECGCGGECEDDCGGDCGCK
jgi:2-iminobutanoate/2-iminopropanoate deaminase